MNVRYVSSILIYLLPVYAYASVVINEVAWMGTANSANDEWIELYNNGSESASLDGWTLTTEDGAMSISLSGSVGAGGYYLIERTDDTTVPNVTADLAAPFGSGLSNSGEILVLKNASGSEADRVNASGGWPAGDNTTKETMQRSGITWITAPGTPKVVNATAPSTGSGQGNSPTLAPSTGTPNSSSQTNQNQNNTNSSSGGSEPYTQPEDLPHIKAGAGEDRRASVGEEVQFRGKAWGLEDEPLDNARYQWNVGDGATREGQNVGHVYMFPGTYMARLTVSSGKYSAFDDLRVVVSDNMVFVSEAKPGKNGWIEFENKGSEHIHVGGWIIETSQGKFVIPSGTAIAARSFAVLSSNTTGLTLKESGDKLNLFYPNGTYANGISFVFQVPDGKSVSQNAGSAEYTNPTPGAPNVTSINASPPISQKQVAAAVSPPVKAKKETVLKIEDEAESPKPVEAVASGTEIKQNVASLGEAPMFSKKYRDTLWFGGSLVLGGVLAVAVVFLRRRKSSTVDILQ